MDQFWAILFSKTVSNPVYIVIFSCFLGLYISFISGKFMHTTRNIRISLLLLPALTSSALLAVNGNLGVSVAILGVFGLTRFKSFPGTSLDIIGIFYAMTAGLLASTGQIIETILLVVIISLLIIFSVKHIESENNIFEITIYTKQNYEDVILQISSYIENTKLKELEKSNYVYNKIILEIEMKADSKIEKLMLELKENPKVFLVNSKRVEKDNII